jgi:CubicO group peptidase (beta-lactamase class C family)
MTPTVTRPGLRPAVDDLAARLADFHVPGLELAVVTDGEVLVAEGLGRRDAHGTLAMTPRTLVRHGSCGKAFTSLVAACLEVEGRLDLEDPVRRWVPELALPDPDHAAAITVRDVLSHRSGISRHDLTWILNSGWEPEELVRRLAHLPLAGAPREKWEYTNLGYALAGLVLDRAGSGSWQDDLRRLVLEPARMARTTTTLDPGLADDPDQALPHLLADRVVTETPHRQIVGVAPAGSVVSCAEDSARWLLLQLGVLDAVPTSLAQAVRTTHEAAVAMPAEGSPFPELVLESYALGWVCGSYRGHALVWHSGGVDGFLTQTFLLPDRGIGVLASANLHSSPLPMAAGLTLLDTLLGETGTDWYQLLAQSLAEPAAEVAPDSVDDSVDDLVGRYENPGYGELEIRADEHGLVARLGDADLEVQHSDEWRLLYRPLGVTYPLTVERDHNEVTALSLPFDPSSTSTVFTRCS